MVILKFLSMVSLYFLKISNLLYFLCVIIYFLTILKKKDEIEFNLLKIYFNLIFNLRSKILIKVIINLSLLTLSNDCH